MATSGVRRLTIRLQRVQNSRARVVCNSTKRQSHSINLLKSLHWLPISERIKYKIAVLTFKVLQCGQPSYLADLISFYKPTRRAGLPNVLSALKHRAPDFLGAP